MKKIRNIFALIILLLMAAGIFYLGWIQIHLDENTYAVAFTKSAGYGERVYKPGAFSWSLQKIIPGNLKLIKVKILPRSFAFSKNGVLPSGRVYGKLMTGEPDFSYSLVFSVSYLLKEESLPGLLQENLIDPGSMEQFYGETKDKLTNLIQTAVFKKLDETSKSDYKNLLSIDFSNAVSDVLKENIPYISLINLTITSLDFPDIALYRKAKENYFNYLSSRTAIDSEAKQRAAEDEIREASKIELLKKYGELLKKYPELVQVLATDSSLRGNVIPSISLPGEKKNE